MNKHLKGAMVAAAVAGLFVSGKALADSHNVKAEETTIKCLGVNECKGKAECATATHECAGKNGCKGKGWIHTTDAFCQEKGGAVVK